MDYSRLDFSPLPWSHSKLLAATGCGYRGVRMCKRDIDRELLAPKNQEALDGSFLHNWLAALTSAENWELQYTIPDGQVLDENYFRNALAFRLGRMPELLALLEGPVRIDAESKACVDGHFNRTFEYRNNALVGVMDLVLSNKKDAIIIDHKSNTGGDLSLDISRKQLEVYVLLLNSMRPIERYAIGVHDIGKGELIYLNKHGDDFDYYSSNEERITEELTSNIELAVANMEEETQTPNPGCCYCDYRLICKEYTCQ